MFKAMDRANVPVTASNNLVMKQIVVSINTILVYIISARLVTVLFCIKYFN